MQNAYLQSMTGGGGALQYGGLLPGLGMHSGEHASRPWGQKINSNDKLNEWKLFIGQVPLEVGIFRTYPIHLMQTRILAPIPLQNLVSLRTSVKKGIIQTHCERFHSTVWYLG